HRPDGRHTLLHVSAAGGVRLLQRARANCMSGIRTRPARRKGGTRPVSAEQGVGAQPVLLEDIPKALERFDLNLPNPLAGQADLATDLLQRTALVTAQAEAA